MHIPGKVARTKSVFLQSAVAVVFFLPLWLVYAYEVSPGLRPEARVLWDVAVPIGGFVLCVGLVFAFRARRRARERAVAGGRSF
jgi:Sec-independent protein secretion pathway component TatC